MYKTYSKPYITNQGETWDTISMDFYGTPYNIAPLIECNPNYANVLVFEANTSLIIPVLEESKPDTLAPWKRGA